MANCDYAESYGWFLSRGNADASHAVYLIADDSWYSGLALSFGIRSKALTVQEWWQFKVLRKKLPENIVIFGFGQTEDLGWLALKHWSILTHMSVCVCVSLYLSSQKKLGPLSTFWIPTTFRYLLDTLYFQVHIKCLQPFGTFGYLKPVCILWIPWTLNTSLIPGAFRYLLDL